MDNPPLPAPATPRRPLRGALLTALGVVLSAAGAATVPRLLCGAPADGYFDGAAASQGPLARSVAASVLSGVSAASFSTGSARFDGEWAFGSYQMAALGLGQVMLAQPALRQELLPALERCATELLRPSTTAFGEAAWGSHGLDARQLAQGEGHGYLGYLNLALGMVRLAHPQTASAPLHDRLTAALARRLDAAETGLFPTYPGEAYPPDMAMVAGSLALHGRATGADHRGTLATFLRRFRAHSLDRASGLVFQAVDDESGRPTGPPRASGTALSVYALSFVDEELSRQLFLALRRHQAAGLLGFGAMREYAPGHDGAGDIDSGPVLLGVSVSGTGFSLSGARLHGDRDLFRALYRTAHLFGVPLPRGGGPGGAGRRFLSGGPLGNAILLAMLTAGGPR